MVESFLWTNETKCYGKNCPKKHECQRYQKKPSENHFLWTIWNKDMKLCPAFLGKGEKK